MEEFEVKTPEEADLSSIRSDATYTVVDIRFRSGGKTYFFDPGQLDLVTGDDVIIDTSRGPEFGTCASGRHTVSGRDVVAPLRSVIRKATPADQKIAAENREKEKRAFTVCQQKILEHKLDMQLVSAECAFDGSKILFFFTADGRVDFRDLVKNLASVFRTRIELRQIGVRDKAKMVGGLGVCGRPFCCIQFLDDFQPVSIKMAKTQNLSLNPAKISGTCGRLMCCLKYEQEAYEDLIKTAPKAESFVDTPDGRGTVTDVNLLRQTVKVRMEDQPDTIGCYKNCDICVLRSGKAKKNDPPIPKDLAPISSNRKSVHLKETPEEAEEPVLAPVILRSEAAQMPVLPPDDDKADDAALEKSAAPRRRRRKKPSEAKPPQPKKEPSAEQKKQQPKKDQPKGEKAEHSKQKQNSKPSQQRKPQDKPQAAVPPETADNEKKSTGGYRRRHHRRKPKNPNGPSGSAPASQA